ncbi:MAG TPA: adenylate/guanylate cyclase domain-containing protein [Ornithinibacter sp.]|jgi:class 3 adenylate cyclase|nr:adenylate/guanylate cyclase domain-containing protein [Ornithinibacter sp.]
MTTSAETMLSRLLERLLTAAETSLEGGDLEPARATAEEVRAVDPDNRRAAVILERVAAQSTRSLGQRALVTLLFSDIVGSTMLSERVEPEQLRDLFSSYRELAREAVTRYGGNVVQFSGDGILAAFGHPEPHEDDARRAVLAGLDLVVAMSDARADLERRLGGAAEVRVGIHTGRVVISDFGTGFGVAERDSIVGVVPNLAARIQQAAEPGMVVISDVTHQLVDVDFYMHSLGEQELKGISRPVEVFAVERPRYAAARFDVERYRKSGLVGRESPREELVSAWEAIRRPGDAGAGSTFVVAGEAGIGKSRLVAEVVDRVEASAGRVLGAACLPYHTDVSLWPISQLIERVVLGAGGQGDPPRALVTHLASVGLDPLASAPFLGPLLGITDTTEYAAPELDSSAFLDETLARIVEWLAALGRRTPHLFVVEDLHWADPSTLALLGLVVDRRPGGILTLTTTRHLSVVPWRDAVTVLELGRLDPGASTTLVDNLSSGRELDTEQRASIVKQAEGIPLFIEELTRSCLDEDRTEAMPLRLQELFTWRLKAPRVDLRVVQAAATIGPAFEADTVSAVVGDPALVAEQLAVLTAEGVIEAGEQAARAYRFRHALMRDAAYETQVLDVRRLTHARVAEALRARQAEPALVAKHLDLAGQVEAAAAQYLAAGQVEQGRGAHVEATRLLSRAIELVEPVADSADRDLRELTARMFRAASVSAMSGYAAPAAQEDHRRAEELTARLGARPEVLPSLIAIWAYWLVHGGVATTRALIDRLSGMVHEDAYSWFTPEVEACIGWQQFYEADFGAARTHFEIGMAGFRARPEDQSVSPFWPLPNDPIAVSLIALSCVSTARGDLVEAQQWEVEAIRRAEEIGFPRGPFSLAFVKLFAAWNAKSFGDDEKSRRMGEEVVALGREHGYALWTALGSAYAPPEPTGGAEHRAFLEQVITTVRLMGQESFMAAYLGYLAELHAGAGDVPRALEYVGEALQVVEKTGEDLHLPELLRHRARYSLAAGQDSGLAVADLREAVRIARHQGARVARLRAAVDLARVMTGAEDEDWRTELEEARKDLPPTFASSDTVAADDLLAH